MTLGDMRTPEFAQTATRSLVLVAIVAGLALSVVQLGDYFAQTVGSVEAQVSQSVLASIFQR